MLRTVRLHGDLADFVGHKELDAHITNPAEAVRFLITNFPKLEKYMNEKYYKVVINEEPISHEEIHDPTGQADINIVPVITGAGGGLGKVLLGAALVGLAFAVPGSIAFTKTGITGGLLSKGLFGIGASLMLGGVSQMLFPLPEPAEFNNEEDPRISFGFSGIQNVSRAGTTIPLVYGEIVTGSVVISAGIDTDQVQA